MLRRSLVLLTVICAVTATSVIAQPEPKPGGFGLSISVDGEGFLNPTLTSVTVRSVSPGRPASAAGIQPGDQIVEVEGKPVAGTKARELEHLMKKNIGETLKLRIRRPNGEVYAVSMVAAVKPN